MKVSELIKKLQAIPQDLEVYSFCDHGQAPGKSGTPSVCYAVKLSNTIWDSFSTCKSEAKAEGYDKQFVML